MSQSTHESGMINFMVIGEINGHSGSPAPFPTHLALVMFGPVLKSNTLQRTVMVIIHLRGLAGLDLGLIHISHISHCFWHFHCSE